MKIAGCVLLLIYLFMMSVYDIRKRRIHMGISAVIAALLGAVQLCLIFQGEVVWYGAFTGVAAGGLMLGISRITGGELGFGDGIVFVISGLLLGLFENVLLLFISLLFSAVAGIFLLLIKHVGRKYTLPFIPFVFAGYGVMCLWKIAG